jgi:transposase
MYAALDLHEKSIQCVLKDDPGKAMKEAKMAEILEFLDGTHAYVVMESGYNHQRIRDVLKEKGYDVKVAHPLMAKAIAYAKVKTDKVDARTLADLLRADMIPESYVPDEKTREVRDLVRRRHHLVETRTGFKNNVKAELAQRWVKHEGDVFTQEGKKFLRSLHIDAVDDYLDTIEFLDGKIGELDVKVKGIAQNDRYGKLLVTIPGVSHTPPS